MKLLLTGATGFVGTEVANLLLKEDVQIVALVRAGSKEEAEHRLRRNWYDFPELLAAVGGKVEALPGDISLERLGLQVEDYRSLVSSVSYIINAAADIRLNASLDELQKTNVEGVRNLLALAEQIQENHGLERFSQVSTAYVAGGRRGMVMEDELSDLHGFLSNYERSKYEGELLVQEEKERMPVSVFRPGMIVGDSKSGWVKTFNTLYYPLRLYMTKKARVVPSSRYQKINLIPVDVVAEAIVRLTFDPKARGATIHLTPPKSSQPTVKELIDFVRDWSKRELEVDLPRPLIVPLPTSILASSQETESLKTIDNYLNDRREFSTQRFEQLCGPYRADWREFLPSLLKFATYHAFLHRSERTVHEQVLFRLNSIKRPIKIFDLVDDKEVMRNAAEIKQEILACASSLKALGVEKGDRVSIVGLNSSRYFSLDIALGLVGAVTVPLYFTSPPAEIDNLVVDSGSKLLFVGSPALLRRIEELRSKVPIISLSREGSKAMSWEDFISKGGGTATPSSSSVDFDDLATIRYTSSTTGQPKGVMFNHRNLRWMAETIATLPPWEARNSPISYLSFLPLNHVVEGILGTYSPYYAPAPISIYFLENFRKLREGLVVSRPSVFFSVPRFYENAWSSLEESSLGRSYLRMKEGVIKSIYRRFVRRGFLKKSGLDRAKMLISGSAPIGDDLLLFYKDLGIEVHNAYGETEAPLVSINRLGRNKIGTVGEPLPDTQVKIAEDGEILVKGPQVTLGYFGDKTEPPFLDGWLLTGDYGHLDDGYLTILGRKKELIKTSYGKFVHPMKIESMIRDIPGVAEAMLIGEGRPFCAALIWVNKENQSESSLREIEREIGMVNSRVSNPEKIRSWALLGDELSIERGELTPNLKLKRRNICQRYSALIDDIYERKKESSGVLSMGRLSE